MNTPGKRVLGIVGALAAGLAVGALAAVVFCSWFYNYGYSARLVSDATVDLAALDRLGGGDVTAAQRLLTIRLEGTLTGLQAIQGKLSDRQTGQYADIKTRAARYVKADRQ